MPSYLALLRPTSEEVAELAKVLCVSETYFLRDAAQFRVFAAEVQARAQLGRRYLRVLSAGCASGEEPYSAAIVLREALPDLAAWDISVLGVDVSGDVVAKARAATYSNWSLRETPEPIRRRYFESVGREHRLRRELRHMVRFEERNLRQDDPDLWRGEAWDVVYCRNVLMYFEPEVARDVVARIARSLSPGGLLFLGHAENLRGLSTDFHLRHSHGTFFYERRERLGEPPSVPEEALPVAPPMIETTSDVSWIDAIASSSRRIEDLASPAVGPAPEPSAAEAPPTLEPILELMQREKFGEALQELARARPSMLRSDGLLLRAALLVTSGDAEEAERTCASLLELDPVSAGAHYVMALCREQAGDREGAIEHDRMASYLDDDFAMPHLHLGLLARRAGETGTARRELQRALELLDRERAERLTLFGGGFGRAALVELCGAELRACGGES